MILFLVLLLSFTAFAQQEVCDEEFNDLEIANSFNSNCNFDLTVNPYESSKATCSCLKKSESIRKTKIDPKWIKKFENENELEKSFQNSLSRDFNDLISLFTKFNNFMLTKDHLGNLINGFQSPQDKICNLNEAVKDIKVLAFKSEVSALGLGCNTNPSKLKSRASAVFGVNSNNLNELDNLDKIIKTNLGNVDSEDKKFCFTKTDYMNLRLSNGASDTYFFKLKESVNIDVLRNRIDYPTDQDFGSIFKNKEMLKDLLTYNPIFSVAFRDPNFFSYIRKKIYEYERSGKNLYQLFQDRDVNTRAYASINASCNRFVDNVKKFLCNDKIPALHPRTMQLHLDDYLSNKVSSSIEREALRDYFAYNYACIKAPIVENPEGKTLKLNGKEYINPLKYNDYKKSLMDDYLADITSIKNNTKDLIKESDNSDIADFNNAFCPQDASISSPLDSRDLSSMTKSFIASRDKDGALSSYLQGEEFSNKTGLRINLSTNPISFDVADEILYNEGKLPNISQEKWNLIAGELAKRGLSASDSKQLYNIIEMQTNRRYSEIEDLKYKLRQSNPETENLTFRQIHDIVYPPSAPRASPDKNNSLVSNESSPPLSPEVENLVRTRFEAVRNDQALNLDYAQDLVFARRKPEDIQTEAKVYAANNNTYDANYSARLKGEQGLAQQTIPWGNPQGVKESAEKITRSQQNEAPRATTPAQTDEAPPVRSSVVNTPSPITPSTATPSATRQEPQRKEISQETEARGQALVRDAASLNQAKSGELDRLNKEAQSIKDEIEKYRRQTASTNREIRQIEKDQRISEITNSMRPATSGQTRAPASSGVYQPSQIGETSSSSNTTGSPDEKAVTGAQDSKTINDQTSNSEGKANNETSSGAKINGKDLGKISSNLGGISDGLVAPGDKNNLSIEDTKKKFNVKKYEYPKIIPHALVEVLGSMESLIIVLGLEGMKFQTIQVEIKDKLETYVLRDFDFVPTGEFETDKELFKDPEQREILHEKYFVFPKTAGSIKISKRLAKFTKEVSQQKVSKSFILQIQNRILNEQQIREEILKFSEKVK